MLPIFALFLAITSSPALVVAGAYGTAWPLVFWISGALLLVVVARDRRDPRSNNRLQVLGKR